MFEGTWEVALDSSSVDVSRKAKVVRAAWSKAARASWGDCKILESAGSRDGNVPTIADGSRMLGDILEV